MYKNFDIINTLISREKIDPLRQTLDVFLERALMTINPKIVSRFLEYWNKVLNWNNLEEKLMFITDLWFYLNVIPSSIWLKYGILTRFNLNESDFTTNFPFLNYYLKSSNLPLIELSNISIRILLSFLDNNNINLLNKLENDLKLDFEKSVIDILNGIKIPDEKKLFVIDVLANLKLFNSKNPLFEKLLSFLWDKFLPLLQDQDKSLRDMWFDCIKSEFYLGEDINNSNLAEINSIISNWNFSKNPLIVVFQGFPLGKINILFYQEQQIFSWNNVEVFNNKKAFLDKINSLNASFVESVSGWKTFSLSLYKKRPNWKNIPTSWEWFDFSKLFPANTDWKHQQINAA